MDICKYKTVSQENNNKENYHHLHVWFHVVLYNNSQSSQNNINYNNIHNNDNNNHKLVNINNKSIQVWFFISTAVPKHFFIKKEASWKNLSKYKEAKTEKIHTKGIRIFVVHKNSNLGFRKA